ncbi:NUDIX domain-containing protein [Cytophaga aurantiaca]|uniref:NUDIX domain-containing protein n=1 Tax=Cytophaga aurantiaca TaxID=29530 RepID=UPI0003603F23|nr:NUDIX domain-containing protein [Cytophaga aurantiaca]
MEEIKNEIIHSFGNKLRIRACGICMEDNKILLVKHHSLGKGGILWAPPGGGMVFGETTVEALKREFIEETGLTISVEKFLCVNEYLAAPLHAIELFFLVKKTDGTLKTGVDPELHKDRQIITQVEWLSFDELNQLPAEAVHSLLHGIKTPADLLHRTGYFS